MNIISVTDITKTYTERKLFEKASFYLQEREKVGVIGINGTGKSTLLKIAAGIEEPDEGQVIRANHIVVRYLPQNPVFDPELSVIDTVLAQSSQNFVGGTSEQNQNAGNHAEHVEHWNLESDAKAMMTKLGITNFEQKAGELSGGQRKRLALVAALLVPCDVLILDEPTNHLDSAMADWLEDFLKKWRGALIMVTHDRYFLDRVVNRIFAFEEDGKICQYEGGYTDYVNRLAEEGKVPAGHILDAKNDTTTSVDSVEKENQTSSMDTWKRERKLKFSYKEQKEYETIEDDIAALEQKIEELDAQTLKFSSDFVKLNEITKEKEQTEQLLEEKMERWEYLEDLAAKIAGQQ